MRNFTVIVICLITLLLISGCDNEEAGSEMSEPPINVVTTIYPISDIIVRLGGDKVNVTYLLPSGASPHTYEPTVEQARLVAQAHLFVYVGAGLDDWAVKLTEAAGPELTLLNLSEEVPLVEAVSYRLLDQEGSEHSDHDHDDCDHNDHNHDYNDCNDSDCGHDHGIYDPHFWLDPLMVRDIICPAIREQLVLLDPGNEEYFTGNYDTYFQKLTVLHEEIEEISAAFAHNKFIAFHSAWQYFGLRYNLQEVAVIAQFPGQEPSAGWVAELIDMIKSEEIGALFAEPQFSSALADRIAEESGSEVAIIDPLGGEDIPGRETYIEMMRFNLNSFQNAMK